MMLRHRAPLLSENSYCDAKLIQICLLLNFKAKVTSVCKYHHMKAHKCVAQKRDEWSALCSSHFTPGKKSLVPNGQEAG